jgi:predicted nucleotidyltransferase
VLSVLITSKARVELLTWFLSHPGERFHYVQLSRILRASRPSLQNELKRLEDAGILVSKKEANVRFYWINEDYPLYPELKSIIFKTVGLGDRLRESLRGIADVQAAFIYGSVAKNREDARSGIDLMVVGEIDQDRLHEAVMAAKNELGREINYSVYDHEEWRRKLTDRNSFVADVAAGPKIFIVGDEDALR